MKTYKIGVVWQMYGNVEFGVNKIDWGKYEITGNRKQIKK